MGKADKFGNMNVSKFNGRPIGYGGFINITTASKKVVYCGTFTTGSLKVVATDGKVKILQEGQVYRMNAGRPRPLGILNSIQAAIGHGGFHPITGNASTSASPSRDALNSG
jgi:hypothetical protein